MSCAQQPSGFQIQTVVQCVAAVVLQWLPLRKKQQQPPRWLKEMR
ncbi:hypothetical protein Vch1786_I2374 [Vibrio cholerae O1 str. 2010EL-1786]|uniref:Prophage Lp2 protein 6 n=1 Tax=Vibrio cholerae (strain MO10) TaxID=345072 RepID=A0A0X1L5C6_VIBCO|nr:hypothetical protein Vch1786_I2374 [Vibrio cholerae O1 str. 2010EL-1786]EET25722.1 prophage Lp2 protein 6 [Vibrio cholerae MO10]